jgi:hypothetical protein
MLYQEGTGLAVVSKAAGSGKHVFWMDAGVPLVCIGLPAPLQPDISCREHTSYSREGRGLTPEGMS